MSEPIEKTEMPTIFDELHVVSIADAERQTGVSRAAIAKWAKLGEIKAMSSGRQVFLPAEAIAQIQAKAENWKGENNGRKSGMYTAVLRDQLDDFLSLADAGALVNRDPMTLRRWILSGHLRGYRFGRHQVFVARMDISKIMANLNEERGPFDEEKGAA